MSWTSGHWSPSIGGHQHVRLLDRAATSDADLVTGSAVVARVWRGGGRQARLPMVLRGLEIECLTPDVGRELGALLGRSGAKDVVDAHVARLTRPGDIVVTSDPGDLAGLLAVRGVAAAVRSV